MRHRYQFIKAHTRTHTHAQTLITIHDPIYKYIYMGIYISVSLYMYQIPASYRIFMRKTSSNNHIWSAYSKPFSVSVWLAVITLVVSFVVMIRLTTQFSPLQEPLSLSDSTLVISGFVCCQGLPKCFLSVSLHALCLFYILLCRYFFNHPCWVWCMVRGQRTTVLVMENDILYGAYNSYFLLLLY